MTRRWATVIAVVAVVAAACSSEVTVPTVAGDAAAGAVLFEQHCAECHGDDAAGDPNAGPSLLDERYLAPGFDDLALVTAIVRGADQEHFDFGAMPRTRGLSEQDLADLIALVRALQAVG